MTPQNAPYDLIVVLPVHNEEGCLEKVLREWHETLRQIQLHYKLLVISDGPSDNSSQILTALQREKKNIIVFHTPHLGYAKAIRLGYEEAIKRNPLYIFQVDSDDQISPQDFPKFWQKKGNFPCLLGARIYRDDPLIRQFVSYSLRKSIRFCFNLNILDANIPYRLYKTWYLKKTLPLIPPHVPVPNIFSSLLAVGHFKELPQIPVTYYKRKTGKTWFSPWKLAKTCLVSLKDILAFRISFNEKIRFLQRAHRDQRPSATGTENISTN